MRTHLRTNVRAVVAAVGLALAALFTGPVQSQEAPGSLSDDGRVGVLTDLQGTALVRPAGRTRWSPVGPRSVLLPGDELRTMARGAHAAEVRLANGGTLVLGPGALVQIEARGRMRLRQGDAEITGAAGHVVTVTGPGAFETKIEKTTVLRADGATGSGGTTVLAAAPRWLTGYRASTTDEWMGSLLAKVDGRDVPLHVGYHKVSVAIRDQIAETTVEESFVNTTPATLEGVFSFPLPAGASISGFGMWIGEELVEADIIERERARAIYEDILARKKDPGLLEWSGGNLFKASVFPIFGHSEKRIRLRYTQVLPLEGTLVRYRYALRSELLRTNPLRELQIHVAAQSAASIVSATSPTHEVRVTKDAHTATLDYSASQVTPDRDFEIVLGLEATSPLRVVAHRRGDDGYFMALLAPPDPSAGAWKRDLTPEGAPLDVLFVADTSGSMGPPDRGAQRAFIESALALLGPDDTFRLMASDANVVWLDDAALPATEANVTRALDFLERRFSLGWTDLDKAFAAVAERATDRTTVVYVGDGIGTTGDADPVALAQRIARAKLPAGAAIHAVATGSSYEQGVLEAMAARGGGSARNTGDDPARAAYALFSEVAQPAVKDLQVAFEGIRTARVYPAKLPNLAAGTQQIVLGRFLPEGAAEQRGRVKVTGTLAGKPVSYTADLVVAPGEEGTGNSFLPRLWARRHLDALLAEGRTPAIKDEIVAMSQSYGIITPYTSFLVLENDEDRERYGVARRVAMRDGERFFTEGRTAAATTALRDQMQKARSWRLDLRRAMLAEIAGLGRGLGTGGVAVGRQLAGAAGDWSGDGVYRGPHGEIPPDSREPSDPASMDEDVPGGASGLIDREEAEGKDRSAFEMGKKSEDSKLNAEFETDSLSDSNEAPEPAPAEMSGPGTLGAADGPTTGGGSGPYGGLRAKVGGKPILSERLRRDLPSSGPQRGQPWLGQQLFQWFPGLPSPPTTPPAVPAPAWDAEVAALLASVSDSANATVAVDGRVEISWRGGTVVTAGADFWPMTTGRALLAADRWFVRTRSAGTEPYDQWLSGERGVLATGMRLGRRRAGAESDRGAWAQIVGRWTIDFARSYASWTARIVSRDGAAVVVELTAPGEAKDRLVVTIDTEKHVIVQQRTFRRDTPTGTTTRSGFVLAGGLWWATDESQIDGDGKPSWQRTVAVREVPAAEFTSALATALAGHENVIFLDAGNPRLAAAKQAVHDGRGTFADHLTIASDHVAFQRWDDAWAAWDKARATVDVPPSSKPGADWIQAVLLSISRRGERFATEIRALAASVVKLGGPAAHGLARRVNEVAANVMSPDERLGVLDVVVRATDAGSDAAQRAWEQGYWAQQRAYVLMSAGRHAEAVAIWRALWKERPNDPQRCLDLMNGLANTGDVDGALEVFRSVDLTTPRMQAHLVQQFFSLLVRVLGNAGRYAQALEVTDRWITVQPEQSTAYTARLWVLLALGKIEDFDAWIAPRVEGEALPGGDPVRVAQLTAAIDMALGQDWNGYWNLGWYGSQSDPRWVGPLGALARRLARDPKGDLGLARRITLNYRWQRTDAHRQLMEWLRADLVAQGGVETPKPADLAQLLAWLPWDRNSVDAAVWRGVTDRVEARWRAAKDDAERSVLLGCVLHLLDAHVEPDEAVKVLREELTVAAAARVPQVTSALMGRLVRTPWTQALEDEVFALVPRLVTAEMTPDVRRAQFAGTARWIVDRLAALRNEAALPPQVEREKLPRADLKARQVAARIDTRRALAARLAVENRTATELLRPWYEIERLGLATELGTDAKAVEAEARELLLSIAQPLPAATVDDGADDEAPVATDRLTWILRERAVLVLSYLAVRRDAPEGLADRVIALLHERLGTEEKSLDWRYAIFRLLVALDRPKDLETALRAWIVPDAVESRWRRALGYLLAETNRVKDAAEQFEEVARLGELAEPEFAALADWYLVLGDDARRSDTLDRRLATVHEYQLQNRVNTERYRVQSAGPDGVPPTMDDEILRVIRVLLAKASYPGNVVYPIQGLYSTTKDFRILAPLADGVVGHTPEALYQFLGAVGQILNEVHEEATCDELRARIEERYAGAKTDTDRRGLTLLMVLVERRAADVLNQPGPHGARALAALRRARQGTWLPGERRLMAEYLASLRKIPDGALAAEQIAQLKDLHAFETAGTEDRLRVAAAYFRTLAGYGWRDEAIDGLSAAFDEYRPARGGALPPETFDLVESLIDWWEGAGRFSAGEAWLAAEAARQTAAAQRQWFERRTFALWVRCLERGGTVASGARGDLYRAARDRMERALADHLPDQLYEVLQSYCSLHRAAHKVASVQGVGDDLVRFSRTLLPEVLPRFGQQASDQVRQVAEAIRDVAGPLEALTCLVERLEAEPSWYSVRGRGYSGWQHFNYRMAEWRAAHPSLGDLEPRLLALVLRELERDLVSQEPRGRSIYGHDGNEWFWSARSGDFARVARKVIAEHPQAPGCLLHTASYLWGDLHLQDEALRTLEDADRRGALREDGRSTLVRWHQELKHWRESLPHAEKLVADRPDNLRYRIFAIRALHGVQRDADGRKLVEATRTHFSDARLRRAVAYRAHAQLADVCVECGYHDVAVALYPEAISDRRLVTRGGRGDSELSRLYAAFSHGLSGLGRHDEAVDAASSAVVIWGDDNSNRGDALRALRDALAAIPDLPKWTAKWESEALASGMDAPVVRLTLARLHLERKEPDAALRHLLVMRRLTPDDVAVHTAIVEAYEMKKDAAGVSDALATSLSRLPKQPDLYPRLATVLRGLGRADDAERALTGLAEYAPNDADGHRRLAKIRTQAGRHDEAAVQWRQVVRIRSAESDAWFELARSLGRAGKKAEAHAVLDDATRTPWGAEQRQAIEAVSREIGAK